MNHIVTRINRILNGVVGCSFGFQPLEDLSAGKYSELWDAKDIQLFKDNRETLPKFIESPQSSTYGFPISVHGQFAGLATVTGLQSDKTSKLLLLAELLTMVLEHSMRNEDRGERLRFIEQRLQLLDENSNVVALRPARYAQVLEVIDTEMTPPPTPSPLTSIPLLIETRKGFPLHRIAVEIHQLSKRWAFISKDDLPKDIFNSRQTLQELGAMTVFIKDLSELTINEQIKLAEYLATKPGLEYPHIIAGINTNAASLEAEGKLLPLLARQFCTTRLQWTDKTPEQVTSDLVKASLQHILEQTRETFSHGEHHLPFNIQQLSTDHPSLH